MRRTMTSQQRKLLKEMIRDHTRRTTSDEATARASLVKEGIITERGDLSPTYGGPECIRFQPNGSRTKAEK